MKHTMLFEEFSQNYDLTKNLFPILQEFLEERPEYLISSEDETDNGPQPVLQQWENAVKKIKTRGIKPDSYSHEAYRIYAMSVGVTAADAFMEFLKNPTKNLFPIIQEFLKERPEYLISSEDETDNGPQPVLQQWENAVKKITTRGIKPYSQEAYRIYAMSVGVSAADAFMEYVNN